MIDASTIEEFDCLPVTEQKRIINHLATMAKEIDGALDGLNEVKYGQGQMRASSISYYMKCGFRGFLDLTGAKAFGNFDAKGRKAVNNGTKIHELLQEGIHSEERTSESEAYLNLITGKGRWLVERVDEPVLWSEELRTSGHADSAMVVRHPEWNLRACLEIKSANDNNYKTVVRSHKPLSYHIPQGLFYQWVLDLPVMIYFYWNKNNGDTKSIAMPFDSKKWDEVYACLKFILDRTIAWSKDEGSPPEKNVGFHCRDCPFNPFSCKPGKYVRKL